MTPAPTPTPTLSQLVDECERFNSRVTSVKSRMPVIEMRAEIEDAFEDACELIAALRAQLREGDGYVLVPVEPTQEMIAAAQRYLQRDSDTNVWAAWGAMLAARPSPAPAQGVGEWRPIETVPRDARRLIADDVYAATFQTMGQYRTALLAALRARPGVDAEPVGHDAVYVTANRATADQLREFMRGYACQLGSQKALAEKLDFSQAYLSDVLHGRRKISGDLAEAFGYRLVTMFERIDSHPPIPAPPTRGATTTNPHPAQRREGWDVQQHGTGPFSDADYDAPPAQPAEPSEAVPVPMVAETVHAAIEAHIERRGKQRRCHSCGSIIGVWS